MMIRRAWICAATLVALVGTTTILGQGAAQSPASGAQPVAGPAAADQGGGAARGRGRGNRAPATPEDLAEIARLETYPAWAKGAGDGNFSIGPDYAPSPEATG